MLAHLGPQNFVLPPSCPKSDIFSAGIVLVELLMAGIAGDGPIWTLGMLRPVGPVPLKPTVDKAAVALLETGNCNRLYLPDSI